MYLYIYNDQCEHFFSFRPKRKSDEVNGEATNGDTDVNTEEADVEEVEYSVLKYGFINSQTWIYCLSVFFFFLT